MSAQQGREVVIVEAVRTPIGRGHKEKGYYKDTHPADLLGKTYTEVIERAGVDPAPRSRTSSPAACSSSASRPSTSPATPGCRRACRSRRRRRRSTSSAARPSRPSTSPPRRSPRASTTSSSARGVEHMGHIPFSAGMETQQKFGAAFTPEADGEAQHRRPGPRRRDDRRPVGDPALRARRARRALAPARAPRRPRRAASSARSSRSRSTATPTSPTRASVPTRRSRRSRRCKPAFKPDGKITAGNSSQISDGAAAVLLMSREKADELGLTPRARIVDQTTVGCDPVKMLEGPIPATAKILERNCDVDRRHRPASRSTRRSRPSSPPGSASTTPTWTASTSAAARWPSATRWAPPAPACITTLLHALEHEDKEIGFVTMCCGGGLGTGTLIQRV